MSRVDNFHARICCRTIKKNCFAALEAMHTWKNALLRWRINNKHFSESLEQLASYNGADMYKYNMIYTFKINHDVLTPES